ncbi:unnamed protein product [Urochloa humidicola]
MAGEREEVVLRDEEEEEDYIDMDLSSAAAAAKAKAREEFEFMSAPLDRWGEPVASPADELFYKGKLLPLHLPPRIQMVEELLVDGPRAGAGGCRDKDALGFRTAPATPYESCNASPANSCYVSGELNVEEYFQEYAAGLADAAAAAASAGERKTWSRKLRFMRQLNLGLKLKASKAYLKTIFAANAKQGSTTDDKGVLGAAARRAHDHEQLAHGGHGHPSRAWRKNPFGQVRSNRCIASSAHGGGGGGSARATPAAEREPGHRRSFSSVIVRYSAASNKAASPGSALPSCSSSSSSSSSASGSSSVRTSSESEEGAGPALRRSSSASSEVENPIQGLIAYCKRSQQLASVRKSASDAGFRFLSSAASSKIAAESDDDGLHDLI